MQDSFSIGNNLNPNEGNKLKKPSFKQSCDISKMKFIEVKEKMQLEVKEELDREAIIHEAKVFLYEELGIDDNQKNNSSFENFEKGIIDELILGNGDLAIQVYETNGAIILDGLKQLATWEGLKAVAESLKESVGDLFGGDAYERGKAVAELGLIGTGVYAGVKVTKIGIKNITKLRVKKENIVKNIEIKEAISTTAISVASILKKDKLNLEESIVKDVAKIRDNKLRQNRREIDKLNTVDEKVDYFYKLVEDSKPVFRELLNDKNANKTDLPQFNEPNVKNRKKAISKIEGSYNGKIESIGDLLRGIIVYDNITDLRKGLDRLVTSKHIDNIHIKDRLDKHQNDIQLSVQLKNGLVTEIQLQIKEILKAKEVGYILDKSIVNLDSLWSISDYKLLSKLKKGEIGKRELQNKNLELPKNTDLVIGHDLYEIKRSLGNSPEEKLFGMKLQNLEQRAIIYAKELHKKNTGEII